MADTRYIVHYYSGYGAVSDTAKETKAFDDAVTECGIMGVVVFIPTADAIRRDLGRNHVHG